MAISFAKSCKDICAVFPPCFVVIPGHARGKNGTCPIITPNLLKFLRGKSGTLENLLGCVLVAYLFMVHPVKYLPMMSSLGNMSQMPRTDFFNIYFYIFYCINGVVFFPGSLRFLI